jgi:N-acetylglucosaminyldiphosphoundecaprenol N-acetyl-beta-D-mannosaminyltransferase
MSAGFADNSWKQTAALAAAAGVNGAAVVAKTTQPKRPQPMRPRRRLPSIRLNGVNLHQITQAQCVEYLLDELDAGHGGMVVTPNLDHLRRCETDLNFGALVAEAQLVVADGMPLVWASRLQRTPLPERIAGSDLVTSLTVEAGKRGRSVFLLGGATGTAEGAAALLKERFPETIIAGTFFPPAGFEYDAILMSRMEAALQAADPDIVYVALGSPKQERLIGRLKHLLPHTWWMGVGVSFSFLTGDVKRAPRWMQVSGLEWTHRLVQEPRRLFKRYVVTGIPYAGLLLTQSTLRGVFGRFGRRLDSSNGSSRSYEEWAYNDPTSVRDETNATAIAERRAKRVVEPPDLFTPDGNAVLDSAGRTSSLARLRGFVLLGGSVRQTPLSGALHRSVLDLPSDSAGSILNHWLDQAQAVARIAGLEKLPVRVLVDRSSPEPTSAAVRHYGTFRVERDRSEYRGSGGVLRDLASDYADDDLILVANATQVLLDALAVIATALDRKRGDVVLLSHRDGTPSGIMLITCKTLRQIPATGFVDMKEQALPAIASRFDVKVLHARRTTGVPVWSLQDYIGALRQHHGKKTGRRVSDPLAEDWQPTFSIIESGATVDPTARIHDAVVLEGAVVEAGALIVRSIVCPGAIVRRDATIVDEIVKSQRPDRN